MNTAKVAKNEYAVCYSERPDVGRDFLSIDVPGGWDDVKKLTKKVLKFNNRSFVWCSWNSDDLKCYFVAPHGGSAETAKVQS